MPELREIFNQRVNKYIQYETKIYFTFLLHRLNYTFEEIAEILGDKSRQVVQQRFKHNSKYYLSLGGEQNNGKEI